MFVADLKRYPLKGALGIGAGSAGLAIDPSVGVVGDRQYAVKRKESVPDSWSPKGMFYVGMNTPAMVAQFPWDEALETGGNDYAWRPPQDYIGRLGKALGVAGDLPILNTERKFNMTDTKGPSVSFLNLATVRALSAFVGHEIEPERFRMNVLLDGLEPFEEYTWIDGYPGTKEFEVGHVRFRADDACERCKAIEANPREGRYDQPLLQDLAAFMQAQGYPGSPHRNKLEVMGIIAVPLTAGMLHKDDCVRLL